MEDRAIIDLYFARSESALSETAQKFGDYCYGIAYNILRSEPDSDECVNDTYMHAWESIPPSRPSHLGAFLGRITRNLALNRLKYINAQKRADGEASLALDELSECVASQSNVEKAFDDKVLAALFDEFLSSLGDDARYVFIRRYWYLEPVKRIAQDISASEGKVGMSLHRSRMKLKKLLMKEGFFNE